MLLGLLVAFCSFVVIAVKVGNRRDAKRLAALTQIANELGLQFTPYDNSILSQWGGYAVNPRGGDSYVTSIMRGHRIVPFVLFDYMVKIGSANNKSLLQRTVAAFDVSATPLPVFEAEGLSTGWFNRAMDKTFDTKGIEFADDPEFTRTFKVRGQDADAIRRALHANARALLVRTPEWTLRSTGRWLLFSQRGDRPKPEEFGAYLDQTLEAMRTITGMKS